MALEYQNLFTTVQVATAGAESVPLTRDGHERTRGVRHSRFLGWIGDAQIGPIYLGWFGVASALCFLVAFEITGLNKIFDVFASEQEALAAAGGA